MIYNLGNTVVPSYIDLEGNASFSRQALMAVGGFNPQVFAGEGAELSYRIVKCFGNPHDLVYWPDAIIYHNYANNLIKYMRKARRDARMSIYIRQMYPDYHAFIESYHPFPAGDIPKARNLWERIELALIRRMIRLVKKWETIRL